MEQVSYRNSCGKVLKNGWVQVDPPCAQTGVKSSLGTFKGVNLIRTRHKLFVFLDLINKTFYSLKRH